MSTSPSRAEAETALRVARILAAALGCGVLTITLIAIFLTQSGSFAPPMPPPAPGATAPAPIAGLHPVVAVLSLVGIALAFFGGPVGLILRAKILAAGRDPETGCVALSAFTSAHLLAHAIFESFGLIGAVTILLSGALIPGLPLALLAILFIVATFPSRRALVSSPLARPDDDTPFNRPT